MHTQAQSTQAWRMPDEGEPHKGTWMSYGANPEVWGDDLAPEVNNTLANIANAIAKHEPVFMLVSPEYMDEAREKCDENVTLIKHQIDDVWLRDTGCVFVEDAGGRKGAVNFNFNGWGNKQEHDQDATVAPFMANHTRAVLLKTPLVLEGGGIEVDGEGTAIITESCVLNKNRNPGVTKAQCEKELMRLLGLKKIIWLPGIAGEDITDGHTDFYARFVRPGIVVAAYDGDPESFDHAVTKKHLTILRAATDAKGRKLKVVVLEAPETVRPEYESDDFAAGYINFYVFNGGVLLPQFGDTAADAKAKNALEELFPDREIIQLNIDPIAAGGGGIHCVTQQEPS